MGGVFVVETLSVILQVGPLNCADNVFSAWHRFITTMNERLAGTARHCAFLDYFADAVLIGLATLKVR